MLARLIAKVMDMNNQMRMQLKFRVVMAGLGPESLIILRLQNPSIPKSPPPFQALPSNVPHEVAQVVMQVGKGLQDVVPPQRTSTLIVTKDEYERMGRPTVDDELTFTVETI